MTTKGRRNLRALTLSLAVLAYLCGTLWLCLNISWWFATLYLAPLVYLAVLVALVWAEIDSEARNPNR